MGLGAFELKLLLQNLIGSFRPLFFFTDLTEKSFIGDCLITNCCYRTPVNGYETVKQTIHNLSSCLSDQAATKNSYYEQQ